MCNFFHLVCILLITCLQKLMVPDVVKICVASLILSLVATIYPAWRASKMDPVESLRYE